jgi:hypothetical protein
MKFLAFSILVLLITGGSSQDFGDYSRTSGSNRRRSSVNRYRYCASTKFYAILFYFELDVHNRPWGIALAGGVVGAVAATYWVSRKRAKPSSTLDFSNKDDLMLYISQQDERVKNMDQQWRAEYSKLYNAYIDLEAEVKERDYEEFKAPDTNNDDVITRAEFNTYVRKYLSSFPELSEKDFPKFDEFDRDQTGSVTFAEWQQFLATQKQLEKEKENMKKGAGGSMYEELLAALLEQADAETRKNGLPSGLESTAMQKTVPLITDYNNEDHYSDNDYDNIGVTSKSPQQRRNGATGGGSGVSSVGSRVGMNRG